MLPFHSHQGIDEESYAHGGIHSYSQEETQQQGTRRILKDTAGNLSSVVYTPGGVGLTEREAIEEQVRKVNRLIDEEQAKHKSERDRFNKEKANLESQLEVTKKELTESVEHQRAKDEQLSVKEQQLSAKEKALSDSNQQLRDKDQEVSALQKTNSELSAEADRLAAKIEELDIEYKAEKSGYDGRITELEQQKTQLIADLKDMKKESEHHDEVRLLRHALEMKDQQIEFDKERSELKAKQHELELKLKDASSPTSTCNHGKCILLYLSVTIIDYVTGIGNSSHEQYT